MTTKLKFYTENPWGIAQKRELDFGIDLPAKYGARIPPGGTDIIDTGYSFNFPVFGKLRRIFLKLLYGVDVTGVGALLWPKGSNDHAVLAGVIDAGYRGSIKVKIYNNTNEKLYIAPGDKVAQMVLAPVFHVETGHASAFDTNTSRGVSGGINK